MPIVMLETPIRGSVNFEGTPRSILFRDEWGNTTATFHRTRSATPRRGELSNAIASYREWKRDQSHHLYLLPNRVYVIDHHETNPDWDDDARAEHVREVAEYLQRTTAGQVATGIAIGSLAVGGGYLIGKILSAIFGGSEDEEAD